MEMREVIEEFITYLTAERQVAPDTLRWYRCRLEQFVRWVEDNAPQDPFSRKAFRHFIAYLKERDLSPATVAGYIRILKHFGRWLVTEKVADENPAEGLRQPKLDNLPIKTILPRDAESIIEVAKRDSNPMHYALVMVLRYSGVRAKELLSMRWDKLDLDRRYAEVKAKGGQMRVVYFTEEVAKALRRYKENPKC